jgi:hypothetical protein
MLNCIRVRIRKCVADHIVLQKEKERNPLHGALYRAAEFEDAKAL